MIYAVQPTAGGPVKIGTTENLTSRIGQLEAHYRQPLALLATFPGGRDEERAIHDQFAHLRLGRTEQFQPDDDLMAFLGRPLLVGANPGAVEALVPSRVRPASTMIRSSDEWRKWIEAGAEHCLTDVSKLVDVAVTQYLRAQGFTEPRPKR